VEKSNKLGKDYQTNICKSKTGMKMADRELVEVSAVRLSIIVDMGIRQ
jgi:hypothetical protein